MRIIVHSPGMAVSVSKACFSYLLKLGYILADESCSIGLANHEIGMIGKLKNGSNEFKLKYLLKSLNPAEEPEIVEGINLYFKATKDYLKIKHKTSEQVKWYKRQEHYLINYYHAWLKVEMAEISTDGYVPLVTLINEKPLNYYFLKEDKWFLENDYPNRLMDLHDLLKLKLPNTDCKKSMLCFVDMLMNIHILKEEIFVSPFNDAAKDTHNSYFEFITTIPNVNNLSEEELRYVRQSFTEKLSSFRKVMDNWTTICNKSVDRLESLQYFKEEVFPELALVENCFNTENIFRYDLQNENTDKIYLFAGEITKTAILNYYTALEILTHEERITLENKLQEEGDFERRIPMMIVANERDLILPIKDAVDEIGEKIIKRKFIAAGE